MESVIKNYLKTLILFIPFLFSSQNFAASVSDAIQASENNDNTEAVKLWSELANAGNTIAQYNLASYYSTGKSVDKNKQSANKWLKNATRSGLIEAYLNLNKKAIAPANGMTISFYSDPASWLSKQKPGQYTIQLASSRNKKSIIKNYSDNNIKSNGGYYHYIRNGVDRYALIYGSYKTVAQANKAIKKLPQDLRKKTPWVRKIKSLQKISK